MGCPEIAAAITGAGWIWKGLAACGFLLFFTSEKIGLSKKIPEGSILELISNVVKAYLMRFKK